MKNEYWIKKIKQATTDAELDKVLEELYQEGFSRGKR